MKAEDRQPRFTPQQASEVIERIQSLGIPLEDIASQLGVSNLYAQRLSKSGYWKEGLIPGKTSRELQLILDKVSPEIHVAKIVSSAESLSNGDSYYIHSLRPLLEFSDAQIRLAILRCASRGVIVRYFFPDIEKIFEDHASGLLDLAALIPSDLRTRYRLLMRTLQQEAITTSACSIEDLESNVHFHETRSGFMFSPWNKIVFIKRKLKDGFESLAIQEHHPFDRNMERSSSTMNWECRNEQAEVIGRVVLSSVHQTLKWSEVGS